MGLLEDAKGRASIYLPCPWTGSIRGCSFSSLSSITKSTPCVTWKVHNHDVYFPKQSQNYCYGLPVCVLFSKIFNIPFSSTITIILTTTKKQVTFVRMTEYKNRITPKGPSKSSKLNLIHSRAVPSSAHLITLKTKQYDHQHKQNVLLHVAKSTG